ncbi:hypothetical protein NQ315_006553 [Exocentrus adspersus]|uniref:Uncharacterized protein n=1 Tax=Exocentrus adspersus TaxID=1586481 RepID=A0AAV8VFL2_9CUCU|nr:hypothetical protein NQ315_006553 [Exocentrus adspersus]
MISCFGKEPEPSMYWELKGRNFCENKIAHESVESSLPCSNCAANYIDREPAHLFLDKTIWRLEKDTKVTDSKNGFTGCLLFENWRGLSFA